MTTVLATGGLGFIGSHTCISLVKEGYDVLIIDSLVNSNIKTFSSIKKIISINLVERENQIFFKKGDLRNTSWLDKVFSEFAEIGKPIEMVIHFAGLKAVEESVMFPLEYWDANLNATLSLLTVMEKKNCNTLVFSSSATIYKPLLGRRLDEDCDLNPLNAYGNSKLAIEKILKDLSNSNPNKWKIASLRYFNPVGSHDSSLIGENPNGKANNLFPKLISVLDKKIDKLSIYGNDWPTNDGTCVRDYIHVMDLADSHVASLKFLISNVPQMIYLNIGTGQGTSVLELINEFKKVNDCQIPYQFAERRKGDAPFSVADNSKALRLLDWKPNKTLQEMCKDTWRWYKKGKKV